MTITDAELVFGSETAGGCGATRFRNFRVGNRDVFDSDFFFADPFAELDSGCSDFDDDWSPPMPADPPKEAELGELSVGLFMFTWRATEAGGGIIVKTGSRLQASEATNRAWANA